MSAYLWHGVKDLVLPSGGREGTACWDMQYCPAAFTGICGAPLLQELRLAGVSRMVSGVRCYRLIHFLHQPFKSWGRYCREPLPLRDSLSTFPNSNQGEDKRSRTLNRTATTLQNHYQEIQQINSKLGGGDGVPLAPQHGAVKPFWSSLPVDHFILLPFAQSLPSFHPLHKSCFPGSKPRAPPTDGTFLLGVGKGILRFSRLADPRQQTNKQASKLQSHPHFPGSK